jgi:indole-3-glycerol phosphate synthase/phosphoribosylanthranilate isomerase
VLVSESGISARDEVERLGSHVDAFLVGSSLMRSADPAAAARQLAFGRVKLCGLNCAADLEAARPAAFAGFMFVPESPRHVPAGQVQPLAQLARGYGVLPVGVFRDAPIGLVADIAKDLGLHAVQLHGAEDGEYVRALRRGLPDACEIWTALGVGREPLADRGGDRPVFDNEGGGSGRTFDWALVRDHPQLARAVVAGGLGPHNARAAQRLGAYAIDVGSALDERPGSKSPEKIAALFDALRPSGRQELRACA